MCAYASVPFGKPVQAPSATPTAATAAKIATTAAPSPRSARALRGCTAQATAHPGPEEPERGQRGDADPREQVAVHAMVQLDDVRAGRHGHEELADRVGADGDIAPVDRRVPAGVVRLAQDDALPFRDVHVRAPRAQAPLRERPWRARIAHATDVRLESGTVDRTRGGGRVRDARHDEPRLAYARHLVDPHAATVEGDREATVELPWVDEILVHLGRSRPGDHEVADRKGLHPEHRDLCVRPGVHLERHVSPPRIAEREVPSPADLRDVAEDIEPERVLAAHVCALAGTEMFREPERSRPLAPVGPVRIGCEVVADGHPGADPERDEREHGYARERRDRARVEQSREPTHEPRERDAERDRDRGVELESVSGGLQREQDPLELEGGHDDREDQRPAGRELEPFRDTAAELGHKEESDEQDEREEHVRGPALRAAGRREAEHRADEPDAVPPEREEAREGADAKDARPARERGPTEPGARREEADEHARA